MTTLHSIGYGNRDLQTFIGLLHRHHIRYLADVRTSPYSKQFEYYRQSQLEGHLKNAGIKYVYMGKELGGKPEDPMLRTFDGKINYEAVRMSEPFREGLSRLRVAHDKDVRLVMMCAELRPEHCHRARLIGEALFEQQINVQHVDADGEARPHAQIRERWNQNNELSLF